MSVIDDRDRDPLDAAIARHYACQQEGLPPLPPSRTDLYVAHRHWLMERYPERYGAPPQDSQAAKYQAYRDERWPPTPAAPSDDQLLLPPLD
jgi:hypothetical protein